MKAPQRAKMILFLWFLVLGLGQQQPNTERIDPFARTVWLDPPVSVADDRALRLDVQTSSILLRAQITKLVVCSAVDRSIVAYDETNAEATGCGTSGFISTQVFPLVTEDTASRDHRTPPDLYRVRQRARSLFIKRRLLDPHSPTVWLQATIEVRDEHGRLVEPVNRVAMVRFQIPERALAIGQTLPPSLTSESSSLSRSVLYWLSYPFRSEFDEQPRDDASRDYDELDGREDMNNGTSTRFYHHVHWTSYTAVIFGGLFAVVLLVCVIVRWSRGGGSLRKGRNGRKAREHLSDPEDDDLEANRARKIRSWATHAQVSGLYHTDNEDFL